MYSLPKALTMRNKGSVQMDMSALMSIAMTFGAASMHQSESTRKPLIACSTLAVIMCIVFLLPSPLITETESGDFLDLIQKIATTCIAGILIILVSMSVQARLDKK